MSTQQGCLPRLDTLLRPMVASLYERDCIVAVTSVVGLQWGDEAKGKIVDILTDSHEIVVRYQGGNNAGHTVKFDGETYKLGYLAWRRTSGSAADRCRS